MLITSKCNLNDDKEEEGKTQTTIQLYFSFKLVELSTILFALLTVRKTTKKLKADQTQSNVDTWTPKGPQENSLTKSRKPRNLTTM